MIGLSAVLAGTVTIARRALTIEGTVSLLTLVVAALLIGGLLPAWRGARLPIVSALRAG